MERKVRVLVGFFDLHKHQAGIHLKETKTFHLGVLDHLHSLKPRLLEKGIKLEIVPKHYDIKLPNQDPHSEDPTKTSSETNKASRKILDDLGQQIKTELEAYDLGIFLGGYHHGARPLYSLPGNLIRVDAHTDEIDYLEREPTLGRGSYVPSIEGDVKPLNEIFHWGLSNTQRVPISADEYTDESGPTPKSNCRTVNSPKEIKANTFDIDVDGIINEEDENDQYKALDVWLQIPLVAREELDEALLHSAPSAIGLFEASPYGLEHQTNANQELWNHISEKALMATINALVQNS